MLYEFANALARRGHEVHFIHGPRTPTLVTDVTLLYHPSPAKGWDVGRRALEILLERHPRLRATVISLAAPPVRRLPDGVRLVGLPQQQLADEVFNQTRVFMQASHYEGFGLT